MNIGHSRSGVTYTFCNDYCYQNHWSTRFYIKREQLHSVTDLNRTLNYSEENQEFYHFQHLWSMKIIITTLLLAALALQVSKAYPSLEIEQGADKKWSCKLPMISIAVYLYYSMLHSLHKIMVISQPLCCLF